MKVVRGFLLGTAAGLLTVAGRARSRSSRQGQAGRVCEDLLRAMARDTISSRAPMSALKVGGYLRAEVNFNAGGSHTTNVNGPMVQYNRLSDTHTWRCACVSDLRRARTRPNTAHFARMRIGGSQTPTAPTRCLLNRGFIQFAGFTFGRVGTAAVAPWAGLPGTSAGRFMGADDVILTHAIQYTATLGNGVSATIASRRRILPPGPHL